MLRRKIEKVLEQWKEEPGHKPLILKGVRQCGKTFSVLHFAQIHYDHVVYMNFIEHPEYALIFAGSLDVNHLVMMISAALGPEAVIEPGHTVFIFDEIQECPDARTALKFFKLDGRYDVIGTGSLLGVKGYGRQPRSVPVGYETIIDMYPLSLEEFLWAMGITPEIIEYLRTCMADGTPVPEALHQRMWQLLLQYTVVGGMPDAVNLFLASQDMGRVLSLQRGILRDYEDDMVKYAADKDKPRITECFLSIPNQLAKENKKFQYSKIRRGARSSQYEGSLQWLEDTGVIRRCYNLHTPELPLAGNVDSSVFKVYMTDMGLLCAMMEEGTQFAILSGNLGGYKGAIFENLVADIFAKNGRPLYYFKRDSGLEVDFVINDRGQAALVEVKASTGNTKSTRTILSQPDKYHVERAYKLGKYNVGRGGNLITLPLYMAMFL